MSQAQLERLYNSLTQVFARDPLAKPAINIAFSYPDTLATVSVLGHILTVKVTDANVSASPFDVLYRDRDTQLSTSAGYESGTLRPVADFSYDLRHWTLERMVEDLNFYPGITATIVNTQLRKLLAAALHSGVVDQSLAAPGATLSVNLNPLAVFLKPVAFAIEDHEESIDTALAQLNILTSESHFADFWGRALGITRTASEADLDYTQRIVDTVILKRDNNVAMAAIIKDTFGIEATISDLAPLVLEVNNSICFSYIAGEVYNSTNFLVTVPLTSDDVLGLINKHRAAGTHAFLHQIAEIDFGADGLVVSSDVSDLSAFDAELFPAQELGVYAQIDDGEIVQFEEGLPLWIVGSTPMPGSSI